MDTCDTGWRAVGEEQRRSGRGIDWVSPVVRERVVWRRRSARRAAGRLGWTVFLAAFVCAPTWLIFSGEPFTTSDGAVNPLALVVPALLTLFGLLLVPQVVALVRRPIVSADHYALTVRPGVGRTLVLPWAQLAEIAGRTVDEETFLFVRCGQPTARSGDWPRWWDQAQLRSAQRGLATLSVYDLAVPMEEFQGGPQDLLRVLAQCAPDHVVVIDAM